MPKINNYMHGAKFVVSNTIRRQAGVTGLAVHVPTAFELQP